jgi:hypothetical protein
MSLGPTTSDNTCHGMLADVTAELAASTIDAGRLRPEIAVDDLLALANGIAIQAQDDPELATRLMRIAIDGMQPRESSQRN